MGVFKRISDIISANLNDLTEGFEDPERMLKQAVREMEETIAEVTAPDGQSDGQRNHPVARTGTQPEPAAAVARPCRKGRRGGERRPCPQGAGP